MTEMPLVTLPTHRLPLASDGSNKLVYQWSSFSHDTSNDRLRQNQTTSHTVISMQSQQMWPTRQQNNNMIDAFHQLT